MAYDDDDSFERTTAPEEDEAWSFVWSCGRTPPTRLSKAIQGLRDMEPCDQRYTLADTVWWDVCDWADPKDVEAIQAFRPPSKWRPPKYTLRQNRAMLNKLKSWGWKTRG